MPQENVEIVCRSIQAYNDRDVERMLEYFASDAVVDWSRSRGINAHVFRGHGELRTMVEDFFEVFDVLWIEHERPVEIKDGVVLTENTAYLRGRDGVRVQARSAWLTTIDEGKQTSLTLYQTRREAVEAAGASE